MDKTCGECGGAAARVRKGRCDACYMRQYRRPPVEPGAVCAACGERRRALLEGSVLGAAPVVLCGNCALVAERARPRIASVEALRARLARPHGPERRAPRGARPPVVAPVQRPAFDPSVD